jgi:hypothetical protein
LGIGFQPSDMSLEEIESRIGVLLEPDVITNLKSAIWKERLDGGFPFTWNKWYIQLLFLCEGDSGLDACYVSSLELM